MPAVSDLQARDDQVRIWETAFLAQKYSLLLILPAVCFFVVMGEAFLTMWVGHQITDPTIIHTLAAILALLAIGHGIRLSQHSNFLVLVGCGQHQIFGRLTACTALVVILLSILAVKVFKIGLVGIAWAHLLPLAVISGLVLPVYFSVKMGISIRRNIGRVWIPALRGSCPALLVILVWQTLAPPANWIHILAVVLTVGVVAFGGAWSLSLDRIERLRLKRLFMSRAGS
jgi:O-antigen/teichoic acid export membrane protein